jgi:hypothetical protein
MIWSILPAFEGPFHRWTCVQFAWCGPWFRKQYEWKNRIKLNASIVPVSTRFHVSLVDTKYWICVKTPISKELGLQEKYLLQNVDSTWSWILLAASEDNFDLQPFVGFKQSRDVGLWKRKYTWEWKIRLLVMENKAANEPIYFCHSDKATIMENSEKGNLESVTNLESFCTVDSRTSI